MALPSFPTIDTGQFNNSYSVSCSINGKTTGKIAAFYGTQLRTGSGGTTIRNNPNKLYVAIVSICYNAGEENFNTENRCHS